ncbi:MAG: DUF4097 family beta strand repeat protein [Candidatus Cloacimonetes bacterium]|nr:DUF4097 family beta strand repeat protein [Candidatus Cloacimonadota bacterium]
MKNELNQSHVIPLKPNATIEIESDYVNIFVESHDEESVIFEVELHAAGNSVEECEDIYIIDNIVEENRVIFSFDDDSSCHLDMKTSFVKAIVPRNITLNVENENGRIVCKQITGTINLESENGSIILSEGTGTINVETENGQIRIHDSEGEINAESENGSIKVETSKGETLNLETENGQIKVEKSDYKGINIETENGRVTCEIPLRTEGNANVETENGSVTLIIPSELEFDARCSLEYGSLKHTVGYDKKSEDTDDDERTIHLSKGSGTYHINVETENGSISLLDSKTIGMEGIKVEVIRFKNNWEKLNKGDMDINEKVQQALKNVDFDRISKVLEKKAALISRKSVQKSIDAAIRTVNSLQDKLTNFEIRINQDGDDTDIDVNGEPIQKKTKIIIKSDDNQDVESPQTPPTPPDAPNPEEILETVNEAINHISEAFHKTEEEIITPQSSDSDMKQSRLKILELLEKGIITSEQAERLLSAVK